MSGSVEDNNSSTGGYITQKPPTPPSADDIQRALQKMASTLTGLPGRMVRPRWQPMPPVQPDADTNWASIGVIMVEADDFPYILHQGRQQIAGAPYPGRDWMQRHATLTVQVSFYGPDCEDIAGALRDALYMPQNYEKLLPTGIKLRTVHDMMRAPELVNSQYINRIDLRIEFRQQIDRYFATFNLDEAVVEMETDEPPTDRTITVTPDTNPSPSP